MPFYARKDALLRAAAAELDLRNGRGQTLWDEGSVAAHLRENGLRLRCGNDAFEIDGDLPEMTEEVAVTRGATSRQKSRKVVRRKHATLRKRSSSLSTSNPVGVYVSEGGSDPGNYACMR